MAELWDFDEPYAADPGESEDWSEDSCSQPETSKVSKKRKRGRPTVRQAHIISDEGEQEGQQEAQDDIEDDPFAAAFNQQQQQPVKRQHNGLASPVSVDSDHSPARAAHSAVGTCTATTEVKHVAVAKSKVQQLAEAQRRLRAQIEQTKQLREQEVDDEPEMPSPAPLDRHNREEWHTFEDDDVLGSDDASPATSPVEAAVGGSAAAQADDCKVTLIFKMQGREDVQVRIHPNEVLQSAMDRFRQYVAGQGWGVVAKFLSPDGDRLTGHETAAQLCLEEDDVIEVHLT